MTAPRRQNLEDTHIRDLMIIDLADFIINLLKKTT